jgi:hypothetical protein
VNVTLSKPSDLYDLVAGDFVARNVQFSYRLTLAPDHVVVLVAVLPNGTLERRGTQLLVDGIVVDYRGAKP